MAIRFQCPQCGKTLSVQDQLAGKKVKCPCGATVVADVAGAGVATGKGPSPSQPRSATAGAGGTQRSAVAKPMAARPVVSKSPGPAGAGPGAPSDLSDLFDQLTPTDLETRSQRAAAEASATEKVDPLAAYRPPPKGRSRGGSSGPTVDRPLGLSILAGLAILGILGSLAGAAVAFLAPDKLQQGVEEMGPNAVKLVGGLLVGSAIVGIILVSALLTPKPWAWWYANICYCSNFAFTIINAAMDLAGNNAAVAAGRMTGGLIVLGIILFYLSTERARAFFGIQVPAWLGPVVAIPAGLLIGGVAVLGIGAAYLALS